MTDDNIVVLNMSDINMLKQSQNYHTFTPTYTANSYTNTDNTFVNTNIISVFTSIMSTLRYYTNFDGILNSIYKND